MKSLGCVAKKVGMTTIVDNQDNIQPATIIQLLPSHIVRIKTPEKDGYSAVVVGYDSVKKARLKKPILGELERRNVPQLYRHFTEFRVEDVQHYQAGMEWKCPVKEGDKVDVTGYTKGRGFQGVVKRFRFSGAPDSHGVSVVHRRPMSAGSRWPQRIIKGKRMPGHMGQERKTIKNLTVLKVIQDLVYLRGAVPGSPNSLLFLKLANRWGGEKQ